MLPSPKTALDCSSRSGLTYWFLSCLKAFKCSGIRGKWQDPTGRLCTQATFRRITRARGPSSHFRGPEAKETVRDGELASPYQDISMLLKTPVSVTFNRAKGNIAGHQFLNQDHLKGLTYRMHPNSGTHDSGGIEILQDCGQFGADEAPWSAVTIISNASCQIPTSKASKQVSGCHQVGEGLEGVREVHWGPGRGLGVHERHGTGQGGYLSCGSAKTCRHASQGCEVGYKGVTQGLRGLCRGA